MQRFFYWTLPLVVSLLFALMFGWGFARGLDGAAGRLVDAAAQLPAEPPTSVDATELSVVVIGDSLARGIGDQSGRGIGGNIDAELTNRAVAHRPAINIAISGARTADLQAELSKGGVRDVIANAAVVVVSIGGNDLWGVAREGAPMRRDLAAAAEVPELELIMDDVLERVAGIVEQIRQVNSDARIFLLGLYNPFTGTELGTLMAPGVARWNSALLRRFEDDPDVTIVQTFDLFSHRDRLSADRFHPGAEAYAIIARRIVEAL